MRSPFQDSEFSRNGERLASDRPGPYEPLFGSLSGGEFEAPPEAAAPDGDAIQKTGTTTVGLATTDGVVLAADRRASLGGQVVGNKNVQKIQELQPGAAMTMAGAVGGAQAFIRSVRAECNLYEARRGGYMDVETLATLMSNLLRGGPYFYVTPLLGGVDEEGGQIFSLDASGSSLEDTYTATGSGMQFAYGLLEQEYDEDLAVEGAVPVAVRAIRSSLERDTATGNGVTVAEITPGTVDVHHHDDVSELL